MTILHKLILLSAGFLSGCATMNGRLVKRVSCSELGCKVYYVSCDDEGRAK